MSGALQAVYQNLRSFGALDAQFNYVTMLLHGDGTNGAQNNTFLDSSTNAFTITRNGNTTQGTFTPYGSNWSNYFNGSSGLSCNVSGISAGTSTFTFEAWVFLTSMGGDSILFDTRSSNGASTTGMDVAVYSSGNMKFYDGTETNLGGTVTANVWTHIALVRNSSNVVTAYINGTATGTTVSSTRNFSDNYFWIASVPGPVAPYLNGYMSNLRWVVGTAVYTSNFTPSTTPLTAITNTKLLTCQSNRFVDNSSNTFAITVNSAPRVQRFNPFGASTAYDTSVIGGSGYFDGSGDYLTAAQNAAFNLSTAAFTVEAFIYMTANNGSNMRIIGLGDGVNASPAYYSGWAFAVVSSLTALQFIKYDGTEYSTTTSYTFSLNTWYHVVAVRNSSSSFSMYVNGTRISNATVTTSFNNVNSNALNLGYTYDGASPAGVKYFNGYISNARVVAGTAVYDPTVTTLTVPTAPLTAITNTSLLLNLTNAGILDNAMMNDLETVGNAQISTSVKKYGTGSMSFDGTGDYLAEPTNLNFGYGSGNFTIEFWLYLNATSAQSIVSNLTSTASVNPHIYYSPTNGITYYVASVDRIIGGALSTSTWYHIALSRSSTSTKLFVNGTQVGSTYTDSNNYGTTAPLAVATYWESGTPSTVNTLNGYIDDLRITKGYARYTTTFTPATAAFPDIGPT